MVAIYQSISYYHLYNIPVLSLFTSRTLTLFISLHLFQLNLFYFYSTFPLKEEFKKLVQSKCFGSIGQEVNFVEAIENAYKAYTLPKVCNQLMNLLQFQTTVV